MGWFIYHGVKVTWNDGRTEMFRLDSREAALATREYQFIENWRSVKSATYVGRRIDWRGMWRRVVG